MSQQPQHNPNSHSRFETLTLEAEPLAPDMKPPQEVRYPPSRSISLTFSRKRKGKKTGRNLKASQKNLDLLRQNLHPISFVPAKTLDFEAHRDLLTRLGLWNFVHIKFDRSIRADLLVQLIGNYSAQNRCSYVNDIRVALNRPDLGRALKLPVAPKNKKIAEADAAEEQAPVTEEDIAFLEDLVSNWVLLHEDTWMMPSEAVNYTRPIKEGQFGKVDWAGLIWFMVNEELGKAPQLENCYYASHLQHLMRCHKEDLFSVKQEFKVEIDLKDDDDEEEEEDDVKMDDAEQDVKLCLGHEAAPDGYVERGELERVVEKENVECVDIGGVDGEKVDIGKEHVESVADVGEENSEMVDAEQENVDTVNNEMTNVDAVDNKQENVEKVDTKQENVETVVTEQDNVDTVDAEPDNVDTVDAEQECADSVDAEQEFADKDDAEQEFVENVDAEQEHMEKDVCETERVDLEIEDVDVMDYEEYNEVEPAQWGLARKENLGDHCLQRCNLGGVNEFSCGNERNKDIELGEGIGEEEPDEDEIEEEEEEDDDQEGGFHLLPKRFSLDGFPSGNVAQGMDGMPMRDHFGIDFPSPRDLMLPGSSSHYGNGPKIEISHEYDDSLHGGPSGTKRMRTDGSWDGKMSGDFETGMDQIQQWIGGLAEVQQLMGRSRMLYEAKANECQQASVNQQYLMQELQKRDELIEHLHKARFEEQQKLQTEKFRFEHEIQLMKNLLEGYRKALKATQNSFAEYRAKHPQDLEPLYRDVPGSGGLVLSTTELEKLRIKQEEEERMNRLAIETMIQGFEDKWIHHYDKHLKNVEIASRRLVDVEKGVNSLKDVIFKKRFPETQESAPNEL